MMSGYLLLRLEIVILKKRKAYLLYEWYLPFYSLYRLRLLQLSGNPMKDNNFSCLRTEFFL